MRKTILTLLLLFLLTPASSFASNDSTQEFYQAEKAFSAGNYVEAEKNYRLAFDKYQKMGNLAAYIQGRIAECQQYQGKTEQAVSTYRHIQASFPDSPYINQVQEKIARVYYEAGDYEKAGIEFEKNTVSDQVTAASVAQRSHQNESLSYAAFCYGKTKKIAKAIALGIKLKYLKKTPQDKK